MNGVLTSVVAISGTLAGSTLTYLLGLLNTRRTERTARDERLRQERIAAYVAFAEAMTELRQGVIAKWFLKQRSAPDEEMRAAHTESDKRGATADHARLRIQMLTDDSEILRLIDATFEPIEALHRAPDLAAVKQHEERSQETLSVFIRTAGRQVRGLP
ncbi:hypothetical protein [Amycolatopsis japonica]|uniref:hypothetical protein n=1 Tax=Amycolatopsis japonica TaxID=208439 RepID=UPI00380979DB